MQSFFGAAKPTNAVDIALDAAPRAYRELPGGARVPVLRSGDALAGEVKVLVPGAGKRLEHAGVRIELRGVVDARGEKAPYDFVALVEELAPPGAFAGLTALPFRFAAPALPHDSFAGALATVRYFLRAIVTVKGSFAGAGSLARELEFFVQNDGAAAGAPPPGGAGAPAVPPALADAPVKLEVGIEDCLHIEFEYAKTRFHLREVVLGHIDFMLVRIKLKCMEVAVVRKEQVGMRACLRRRRGGGTRVGGGRRRGGSLTPSLSPPPPPSRVRHSDRVGDAHALRGDGRRARARRPHPALGPARGPRDADAHDGRRKRPPRRALLPQPRAH